MPETPTGSVVGSKVGKPCNNSQVEDLVWTGIQVDFDMPLSLKEDLCP